MKKSDGVYVIDSLANIGAYADLGRNFAKACGFLSKGDFSSLKPGRNELDGDEAFVNFDEANYVAKEDRRPELHRRYFDIHVPLESDELMGLARHDPSAKGSFDAASDCGFYDEPVEWLVVRRGEFAICWPSACAHAPAVTTDAPRKAKKLIVKVRA